MVGSGLGAAQLGILLETLTTPTCGILAIQRPKYVSTYNRKMFPSVKSGTIIGVHLVNKDLFKMIIFMYIKKRHTFVRPKKLFTICSEIFLIFSTYKTFFILTFLLLFIYLSSY